jgi:hypothetical protein
VLLVGQTSEEPLPLLEDGDEEVAAALHMVEPFRHRLYTAVVFATLVAFERERI